MKRRFGWGMALGIVIGMGACRKAIDDKVIVGANATIATSPKATSSAPIDRRPVTLSGDFKGPGDALVIIVEFVDFQCPFCAKTKTTVDRILKEYPDKVRIFRRHLPLGAIHPDAPLAAEASLAAGAQGKFWQMGDLMFANQKALKRPDLEAYAKELGLDLAKFKAALDSRAYQEQVDKDIVEGKNLGVRFTPVFFVNGLPIGGAQPFEEFKTRIDSELEVARKLLAAGVPAPKIYGILMQDTRIPAPPAHPPSGAGPAIAESLVRYNVPLGRAPVKGGKKAKVTIVEYSEFQCPFCANAQATLKQIQKIYGDDVQIAFKHFPMPFHENASEAASAAEAANEQGKFWQMHDKLFANQQALSRPALETYAKELKLDMVRFRRALDDGKFGAQVDADAQQAQQFGVRGTPSFFVNGTFIRGALPFEAFRVVIDEELKKANAKLASGVSHNDLYAVLTRDGLKRAASPTPNPVVPAEIQSSMPR